MMPHLWQPFSTSAGVGSMAGMQSLHAASAAVEWAHVKDGQGGKDMAGSRGASPCLCLGGRPPSTRGRFLVLRPTWRAAYQTQFGGCA